MLSIQKTSMTQNTITLDRNITDLLKFVACIMVAMSHYSGYALAEGVSSSVIYKVIAATGGYLGVAVFFLSGYGLMKSDQKRHRNFAEFCKRRLAKAWLPAVVVSAIWLGVAYFVDLDLLCNKHYLLGLLWWFNDEVMWFIRVILIMYVCVQLCFSPSCQVKTTFANRHCHNCVSRRSYAWYRFIVECAPVFLRHGRR